MRETGESPDDLSIGITDQIVFFYGSRSQLVLEGLIARDFRRWPIGGSMTQWSADGFAFGLRRARPDSYKGKRLSLPSLDSWLLIRRLLDNDPHWQGKLVQDRLPVSTWALRPYELDDPDFRRFLGGVVKRPARKR